jgi:hypothetical protein
MRHDVVTFIRSFLTSSMHLQGRLHRQHFHSFFLAFSLEEEQRVDPPFLSNATRTNNDSTAKF